jgi:hypothetical protein
MHVAHLAHPELHKIICLVFKGSMTLPGKTTLVQTLEIVSQSSPLAKSQATHVLVSSSILVSSGHEVTHLLPDR